MKNYVILSVIVLLLVLIATATGVFYHTPGSPIEYTTVRGDRATFQGSGIYRYDPAWFAREGIVWDVINLFIGLPLFTVAIFLSQRNSLRGRLLLGGLLFYFIYVYMMFMTGVAFNRLFLVYVAIFALSAVAFLLNLQSIDVGRLSQQVSTRFPRRVFICFTFLLGAVLIFLWLRLITPIMISDRFPPDLTGLVTLVSQAIDLGVVVPLLISNGVLLWRRSKWGYLLTSISLTHGFMMFITIPSWIALPLIQDGKINLIEASPFLVVCILGLVLAVMFYGNVLEEKVL